MSSRPRHWSVGGRSARRGMAPVVWMIAALLLQNAVTGPDGPVVPFVMLVVIFYALYRGPVFGFFLGVAAGLLWEIFAAGPAGLGMAGLGLLGFLCGHAARRVFPDSVFSKTVLPVLCVYGFSLADLLFGQAVSLGTWPGLRALGQAFVPVPLLATGILSPFIFSFLRKAS